ncbi:hypothetical protein INT47_000348 [Mucor saturninus]|uniref:Mitochondrial import inner membrane translocase subunit TIM54 n=1 Tax=Mucor saturninus TaxID=64648 RepID=A0A8H7QWI2_9FUNG|nr:hypothetical protein INT47_000348 [Mucor saturninus]
MVNAQYVDFAVKTRIFSPQLLKQVHCEIPYNGLKEQRSSLISCLEKQCESTLSSEFIDTMFEIFSQKFKSFDLSSSYPFQTVLSFRPFQHLSSQQLQLYGLNRKEISAIQSITSEDILTNLSCFAENVLRNRMDKLLGGTNSTKTKLMVIVCTTQAWGNPELLLLLTSIEKCSEAYSEETTKSYKLRRDGTINRLSMSDRHFNMRRNPVILPNNATTEQPKSPSKSTIFINIEERLESTVGTNWRANNIWYGVSIDKNILETVFGSIKKLEKLFFASGILGKDDNLPKAKFCTRGEEILPAIQQKLMDLEFRMKSFFIVAQVSSNHIQFTLHQVVKLSASEEDAASIIIQDEIIDIDDVYDTLCKSIMKNLQVNCQVEYCTTHKNEEDTHYDFQLFTTYSNIYRNLKSCVVKLLEKNNANLDMNSKIQLDINPKCGCSISISLCDIIEVGLTSVIENMAADIVASLTNKTLFGSYVPNYIFVFGNPFNLMYGSKIYTACTKIMQKAIDDGIYFKEKDTKAFVLRESILQLLRLFVPKKKPYLYERFITGALCQVSSETYAIRVGSSETDMFYPFIRINSNGDIKNTIAGDDAHPTLEIIQLYSLSSTAPDKYALLQGSTPGMNYIMTDLLAAGEVRRRVVEYTTTRLAQRVSFLADRPCGVHKMPRKVTVYITAPPGDGLEKSRTWFREYVKPILVAGAVDYEIKEAKSPNHIETSIMEEIVQHRREAAEAASITETAKYEQLKINSNAGFTSPVENLNNNKKNKVVSDDILGIGRNENREVLCTLGKGCDFIFAVFVEVRLLEVGNLGNVKSHIIYEFDNRSLPLEFSHIMDISRTNIIRWLTVS